MPPDVGSVHSTLALPLLAEAVGVPGIPGAARGVTTAEGADGVDGIGFQ